MASDRNEIEATIATAIRRALTREVGEISSDTSLVADLGIDSLDLVEIVFGVEEAFDIQLEPNDLFPQRMLRDPNFVKDGAITEGGVAKLREQFSYTTLPKLAPGMPAADVAAKLLTMRTFADYVAHVMSDKSA
jgi:acyl carrier protein